MFKFIQSKYYGEQKFKFPDGKKLYLIKDNYLHKLSAKLYQDIQENHNYLSYLGVSKTNFVASHENIDKYSAELELELDIGNRTKFDYNKLKSINKKIRDAVIFNKKQYKEFDNANEILMLNVFDLYYFFEDENPFKKNAETLERKRYYLDKYPYFKGFFLQELKKNKNYCNDTWNELTQFVLSRATLMAIKEELTYSNLAEK